MISLCRLHFITLCGLLSQISECPLCKQEVKQAFSSGWGLGGSCLSPNHRFLWDLLGYACSSSQAGKLYPAFTPQHLSPRSKADPFPWGAPALWSIHQWHFAWAGTARIRPHDTNTREKLSSDLGIWSGHATGQNPSLMGKSIMCLLRKDRSVVQVSIRWDGLIVPSVVTYHVKDRKQMVCRNSVKEKDETHLCVTSMHKTPTRCGNYLQKSCASEKTTESVPLKWHLFLMASFEWSDFQVFWVPSNLLANTQQFWETRPLS